MFGGSLGDPILKNKAFFHFTCEGTRQKTDSTQNGTVYTSTLKTGRFRYYTKGANSPNLADRVTGALLVPTSDIATLNLLTIDPGRAGKDASGLFDKLVGSFPDPNNYDIGDGLNTAGYRYSSVTACNANQFVIKGNYVLNSKNRFSLTYARNKMTSPATLLPNGQRTGLSVETNPSAILAFDSTLTNRLLNEFRVGGVKRGENLQNPDSNRYLKQGVVNFNGLGGPGRGNPIDTELADIFTPEVITFADNMTWTKGNFAPNVGFNWDPFNDGKWSISANYRLAYDRHYFTNTLFTVISRE